MRKLYWTNRILLFVTGTLMIVMLLFAVGETKAAYVNQTTHQLFYYGEDFMPESNCLSATGNIILLNDWNIENSSGKVSEFELTIERREGILPGKLVYTTEQEEYVNVKISEKENETDSSDIITKKRFIVEISVKEAAVAVLEKDTKISIILQWMPEVKLSQGQLLWAEVEMLLEAEKQQEDSEPEIEESEKTENTESDVTEPEDSQTTETDSIIVENVSDVEVSNVLVFESSLTEETEVIVDENSENVTEKEEQKDIADEEEPKIPEAPETPEIPEESETPEIPEESEIPEVPSFVNAVHTEISKNIPGLLNLTVPAEAEKLVFSMRGAVEEDKETVCTSFPAFTKYSIDGGQRYVILAEGGNIELSPSEIENPLLYIDFSIAQMAWETEKKELEIYSCAYIADNAFAEGVNTFTFENADEELFSWRCDSETPIVSKTQNLKYTVNEYYASQNSITMDYYIEKRTEDGYESVTDGSGPLVEAGASKENVTKDLTLIISAREGEALAGSYKLIFRQMCNDQEINRTEIPFFVNYSNHVQEALE